MPASPASVSAEPPAAVLLVGLNWLGDSLMSMPAIQAWRRRRPGDRLVMLAKPAVAGIWRLQPAVDETWTLPPGPGGVLYAARRAAAAGFRTAFVLPHSFRSALVPFLARIPARIGLRGHCRDWMLTSVVRPSPRPDREHQCHAYLALLGLADEPPAPTRLSIPENLRAAAAARLAGLAAPRAALLPGAAYGPAKRWPAENFSVLGRMLKSALGCGIVVLGSAVERQLAARVAGSVGAATLNLAGSTSLPECAAILGQCDLAVANDSGGMHLAAAAGTPVLAIFGVTDPRRTGPLGERTRILQAGGRRGRDLPRRSAEAEARLRQVRPEDALAAARELLAPPVSHC